MSAAFRRPSLRRSSAAADRSLPSPTPPTGVSDKANDGVNDVGSPPSSLTLLFTTLADTPPTGVTDKVNGEVNDEVIEMVRNHGIAQSRLGPCAAEH